MERKGIMQNSSSVFGGTCPGITNVGNNILARPPQLQAKEIFFLVVHSLQLRAQEVVF